ncbi:KPN_02809 family neutral zinc metallopeptidase [Membranihabitans marinus]|uniref:KPN_02809 family neutral zinc metallopeptidase n=1 Tax=Membranihabitans marinus TaxID=1227546 RepID=UPI001F2CD20E|nr:neutral zinc metallopeptidase [Membranihabitans marinus]
MKWQGRRQSKNIEDRRRSPGKKVAAGGSIGVIIVLLISMFTGKDLTGLIQLFEPSGTSISTTTTSASNYDDDPTAAMVGVVLASTEEIWTEIFKQNGMQYQPPKLVLFSGTTQSSCGGASASMGPFYCPADQKVYIDLSFCQELKTKFKAPGDFAVAYVIAHEVAHHVQNLLGTSRQVQQMRSQLSQTDYNKLSVKLELQADFYSGVWGYFADNMQQMLDPNDLESALRAANAIGDDKLQKQAQGYVVPDAFTHGTSQQRMYWFKKGFETGDLTLGDFNSIQ